MTYPDIPRPDDFPPEIEFGGGPVHPSERIILHSPVYNFELPDTVQQGEELHRPAETLPEDSSRLPLGSLAGNRDVILINFLPDVGPQALIPETLRYTVPLENPEPFMHSQRELPLPYLRGFEAPNRYPEIEEPRDHPVLNDDYSDKDYRGRGEQ